MENEKWLIPNINREVWKSFLKSKKNRNELIFSLIVLVIVLFCLTRFLIYVEGRQGVILADPILNLFSPVKLTWLTFGVIYISLFFAIVYLAANPLKFLFAVQVYTLMVIFRVFVMYLVPLNPPADMISLNDPIVEIFGTGKLMTKDLYFSGHTATLFIFYLTANIKQLKNIFLAGTIIVAIAVLLQHVHYTVDVISAPFFTYCAYAIIRGFKEQSTPFSL